MIETKRLKITNFTLEDVTAFATYRNKPEVYKYQTWRSYSIHKAKVRIQYCIDCPFTKNRPNSQLAIRLKDNTLIGDFFLEPNNDTTITLGYTLDSTYWRQGYAYEAFQALLQWLNETYEYTVFIAHAYNDNERSIHLLEKSGFKQYRKSKFLGDVSFKYTKDK